MKNRNIIYFLMLLLINFSVMAAPYTAEQVQKIQEEQLFQEAVVAYRFWYPTVSAEAMFHGYREKNIHDNKEMVILAATPKQLGFTLNSDTPYGGGVLDLSDGPFVIEIPPGPYKSSIF